MTVEPIQAAGARVALVTGSASNIGRAIAYRLADSGYAVMVHARVSRDAAEETAAGVRERGGRASVAMADISQPDGARLVVAATIEAFNRIDVLVNNASVRFAAPLADISPQDWNNVISTTLGGTFFMCQAAIPHLALHGGAAIINIGGVAASLGIPGRLPSVTAKAGILGLTRGLAAELAPSNVTVNCVVPGQIDTVRGPSAGAPSVMPPVPLGRSGRPDEIAAAVAFLAGPDGRFITGQAVHVNGGMYFA